MSQSVNSANPTTMPSTMKAWQYTTIQGKLENSLVFSDSAPTPDASSLSKDQLLVEVIAAALNPVDYKLPESGLLGRLMVQRPASPGLDFCGRIVAKHPANDAVSTGQVVFGALGKVSKFGTLGQFVAISSSECALLPEGVDPSHGAGVGTAAMTALQSLLPEVVRAGSRIFINGGSGGVGTFGIQFAKALGANVTTTCSAAGVELCKSLGADEVLDYKEVDVISVLEEKGQVFDLVVDNVGVVNDLYERSDIFLKPKGIFVQVAVPASGYGTVLRRSIFPGILGGGKRRFHFVRYKSNTDDFVRIGQWLVEGKVRVVVDQEFQWQDVSKAFERLRSGHAKGKIIVHVMGK